MNFTNMFQMQKDLDGRIRNAHKLINANLMEEKVLAFQVELGELANETRCFKYWSLKPASSQTVILEEYVDGIHFLLSIGIDLHKTDLITTDLDSNVNLTKQFGILYELSSRFARTKNVEDFTILFQQYLLLGQQLGFTTLEIEEAYIKKNQVNHQRQSEGY